jgi:hypothetical protein
MEKIKDTERIIQLLQNGESTYIYPGSNYKYNLFSSCPNDGFDCQAHRFERTGLDNVVKTGRITKVVFRCPSCGRVFSAEPDKIFLR